MKPPLLSRDFRQPLDHWLATTSPPATFAYRTDAFLGLLVDQPQCILDDAFPVIGVVPAAHPASPTNGRGPADPGVVSRLGIVVRREAEAARRNALPVFVHVFDGVS